MSGKHELPDTPPEDGEVFVDQKTHEVVDTTNDRVVGRTRTTPTKHDGTQRRRS